MNESHLQEGGSQPEVWDLLPLSNRVRGGRAGGWVAVGLGCDPGGGGVENPWEPGWAEVTVEYCVFPCYLRTRSLQQ